MAWVIERHEADGTFYCADFSNYGMGLSGDMASAVVELLNAIHAEAVGMTAARQRLMIVMARDQPKVEPDETQQVEIREVGDDS